MGPAYLTEGLKVPSQYMEYMSQSRKRYEAQVGFFKTGLQRAKKVLSGQPAGKKTPHKNIYLYRHIVLQREL